MIVPTTETLAKIIQSELCERGRRALALLGHCFELFLWALVCDCALRCYEQVSYVRPHDHRNLEV